MLARAFKDEWKDVFPNPEERRIKEPYVSELYLRCGYPFSMAFITSPQLEGIVIWSHSDIRTRISFWKILTSGAIWPAIRIGYKALRKIQALDQYVENKHRELAPLKHWYLWVLAVDPKYQGRGHASRLLYETLSKIDEGGLPCYLETDDERNVSIYQHFGFKVIDEFFVPGIRDKLVAMLRQSKSP
jgi:ribosomal protein S18 acetylase RimI-like enzyme